MLAARDAALRHGTFKKLAPVHVVDGYIAIHSKNGQLARVAASPRLLRIIEATKDRSATPDTPFVTTLGLPPSGATSGCLSRRLKKYKERVGLGQSGWTWHDMRRTAARELYKKTGNLGLVQSLLGHQSLAASLVYLQAQKRTLEPSEVAIFASENTQ